MERRRLRYLADVNVLLAAVWDFHPHHSVAHRWVSRNPWAYCALTELGFIRISLQPMFFRLVGIDARAIAEVFRDLVGACHAEVWTNPRPFHDSTLIKPDLKARQITDTYLCELARQNRGKVSTFDVKLADLHPEHVLLLPTV